MPSQLPNPTDDGTQTAPDRVGPLNWVTRVLGALGAILIVALIAFQLAKPLRAPLSGLAMAPLGDGSSVSVVHVSVGGQHEWQPPDDRTIVDWALGRPSARVAMSSDRFFADVKEHLVVWLVRHDGLSVRRLPWPEVRQARLEAAGEKLYPDFVFIHRQGVRTGDFDSTSTKAFIPASWSHPASGPSAAIVHRHFVYGIAFPKPPSGCGPMRLTLVGDAPATGAPRAVLATPTLAEPAGLAPKATWRPSLVPATETLGSLALTMTSIPAHNNSARTSDEFAQYCSYSPKFELTESGRVVPTRLIEFGPATDAAGNVHRQLHFPGLRPIFPPHRVAIRAVVPTAESLRAGSTLEIKDLPVPKDNTRLEIATGQSARGQRIRLRSRAMGGRGVVSHPVFWSSAETPFSLSASLLGERLVLNCSQVASGTFGPVKFPDVRIDCRLVHLLYEVTGLTTDEIVVPTAVHDDQGRAVPFDESSSFRGRLLFLQPAPDARTCRVTVEIQDTRRFEFTITPPVAPIAPSPGPATPSP